MREKQVQVIMSKAPFKNKPTKKKKQISNEEFVWLETPQNNPNGGHKSGGPSTFM